MALYSCVRVLKLAAVALYASAASAAMLSVGSTRGHRLAHRVASPALAAAWVLGALLALLRGTPLTRPWMLGGLALSVLSNLVVALAVAGRLSQRAALGGFWGLLLTVLALMVFRPN